MKTYARKIISAVLVLLMLIQVVAVVPVQANPMTPMEKLNYAISEGSVSEIQEVLEGNLIETLPLGYSGLSIQEKEAIARLVATLPKGEAYSSEEQLEYTFNLAYQGMILISNTDLFAIQFQMDLVYNLLSQSKNYFTNDTTEMMYKSGVKYEEMSGVDRQLISHFIQMTLISFHGNQGSTELDNAFFQVIFGITGYPEINKAKGAELMLETLSFNQFFKGSIDEFINDNPESGAVAYPLDFDKLQSIHNDSERMTELANWLIGKMPQGGFASVEDIQKSFDQFFNPADPLRVINEARATKNTDAILGAITQPEWLDLPAGFDTLQPEEKKAIANVVMTFLPSDYTYNLKKQVQYAVEIGYKGIQTIKQTDKIIFQQHLNEFYSLFVESTEYFEYPGMEMFKELGQKYLNASNVDKELLAYTAKRLFQGSDLSIEQVYGASLMLVMNYSYINDAIDVSEMKKAMLMLYSFQQSTEMMEPFEPFLLKLNAMKDLVEDDTRMGKLAQWMLDRKPANGYSSISEVQTAFDRFFDQIIIITPTPTPSTGGGSAGSTPVTSTPAPTTKQEQIVVDVNGTNGTNLTKTPITRTTETNGTIKDLVKMTEAIAKESVEKAKQLNMNTARIVIPDSKDSVSETRIELPKAAVKELNDGSLKLEISTENVVISVPTNSIAGFDQDLYFRVVPLKKESERKEVEERAKKEQLIQQVAPNTNVRVLARPVEIDTNMQSREVTLTLPLRDSLPTDPAARQQALDNLAIYIEHSDGTKELIQGKLVQLADNSEGIEFTVTKFSTFTLVVVDGLKASQGTHQPYIQGFGTDFRPDAFVTRAQMAAMLARNLPTEAASSVDSVSYKDVSATHWATSEIQKAQSAGIMNGMSNTQFAPEGSITRAQMATIAYRWTQQQASATTVNGTAVSFTDVSADLWAAEAIAYVQSAGLMVGYNDGTFKPDSKLTRAEAVKVLNVLFNRTPLTGEVTPTFSDVPATHWAYANIEAAAQK
ncbi:S-layer homology domain-containing protein [Paenibacillus sp. FSL H7-0940]|uniref:S-layer homology domain-containing protein n=1 Tax=Paenibacillus sp. FSL H7-0940 TaxID=2921443 RepID=UPI0030ED5E0F